MIEAETCEKILLRFNLSYGYTAMKMGAYVMGFGRRRIVHITADIKIQIFCADFLKTHTLSVSGYVIIAIERGNDFFNVLRPKVILSTSSVIFGVGIDEEDFASAFFWLVRVGAFLDRFGRMTTIQAGMPAP